MSDTPKISVLVPCYNRAATIAQCLDSVLSQPYSNFEVICSDNGSTDATWEILCGYAKADARIRTYRNASNLGPMPNWKNCLDHADGDYIHWLWSDDWIDGDFYMKLVALMNRTGRTCAASAARVVYEDGYSPIIASAPAESMDARDFIKSLVVSASWSVSVSPACYLLPAASVRRWFAADRNALPDPSCYDKAIGPDAVMVLGAVADTGGIAFHASPLSNFRHHTQSISVTTRTTAYYFTCYLWFASKSPVACGYSPKELLLVFFRATRASVRAKSLAHWISLVSADRA